MFRVIDIDRNLLISLYCDKKLSLREISRQTGITHGTISRYLKESGVEISKGHSTKRIEVLCDYCQKPIVRYPSTLSTIRGNFCSYVCIYAWQSEGNMKDEKSPAWKGGITRISSDNLKTVEWREAKKIVLDKFPICSICGNDQKRDVHHIKTRKEHPELVFEINNLITVCRSCHSTIKGKEKKWEDYFTRIVCKGGELRGNLNAKAHDNPQPSQENVIDLVSWKVHRLTVEDSQSNKTDTSAAPERDEIVGAYGKP